MAKCRKSGRGKKMEDEEIQKLQQQHQQQRQRKEQSNSNIDRDQSRPPDTVMANPRRSERQQSRKVENQHTGQKEVAVIKRHGNGSTGGSIVMVADTNTENIQKHPVLLTSLSVGSTKEPPAEDDENEGVADEEPLQAPAAAAVVGTAPVDPRKALLGAIRSRRRDDDGSNGDGGGTSTAEDPPVADDENKGVTDEEPLQAPAAVAVVDTAPVDPRKALLGAIESRHRDGDEGSSENQAPVDPRMAIMSAIRSRRRDDNGSNGDGGGGSISGTSTAEDPPVADDENKGVADEEPLQASAVVPAVDTRMAMQRID